MAHHVDVLQRYVTSSWIQRYWPHFLTISSIEENVFVALFNTYLIISSGEILGSVDLFDLKIGIFSF